MRQLGRILGRLLLASPTMVDRVIPALRVKYSVIGLLKARTRLRVGLKPWRAETFHQLPSRFGFLNGLLLFRIYPIADRPLIESPSLAESGCTRDFSANSSPLHR